MQAPCIGSTKPDGSKSDSRPLITEPDSAHFGGPSFGEQSIAMMAEVLDDVLAALPPPVAVSTKRELAAMILRCAANGERNPDRLRKAVLGELSSPKPNIRNLSIFHMEPASDQGMPRYPVAEPTRTSILNRATSGGCARSAVEFASN